MARRSEPTRLKMLLGNPGKHALNKEEPYPDGEIGDPPDWLASTGKERWRELVSAFAETGVLTIGDRENLANYCQVWARMSELEAGLDGLVTDRPTFMTIRDLANLLARLRA